MASSPQATLGGLNPTLDMPGQSVIPVTKSDTEVLKYDSSSSFSGQNAIARRLVIGTAGHVTVRSATDGSIATFKNQPNAGIIDGFFDMVMTATTAQDIVAQT